VHPIETIFEENKGKLFSYLVRMAGNADTASDILQESVTRCMERYQDHAISPALLFTVARNALIDHMRRHSRHTGLEEGHRDDRADPERSLLIRDRYARVLAGLQRLDPEERDIISLVVSSGLSYRGIAAVMSMSEANIKVKVHRARLKLKSFLQE
jgi:RNA polymerase sigma-70 factor (ECF subfamily)